MPGAENAAELVVRAEGLQRRFPPDVRALDNVSLSVRRGEWVAVTGRSGSGKSTLLNVLGLLDRANAGRYWLNETAVESVADRNVSNLRATQIGFVFQAYHLLSHLSVQENVELGMRYLNMSSAQRRIAALDVLDVVGMNHRIGAYPGTLSGGEQQRVAIARAVSSRPPLLLCDEPTGNLDTENARAILDLFEDLHTAGQSIVMVTHEDAVAAEADRTVRMNDGGLYG